MNLSNFGATCRTLLFAVALASLAVPSSAQIVERSRTLADLLSSHPCTSGLAGRHTIVTDCDAADDLGDGEGAFSCFARCDGIDTWAAVAIGAGGGGLPGADEVTESMLKVVNACTDEYVLTCETTTGDFEWQAAATGDVVGPASATDNCIATFNSTTGKLIQCNSAATLGDTGRLILDSSATAYATPTFAWSGDTDTGFTYEGVSGGTAYVANGAKALLFSDLGIVASGLKVTAATFEATTQVDAGGVAFIRGEIAFLFTALGLSASPTTLTQAYSNMVITNESDTAEHVLNLPTASAGAKFTFVVQDVDGIKVVAAAGDTIRPIAGTAASAAAGFIRCATQGAFITLVAINATEWVAIGSAGTWTIDV